MINLEKGLKDKISAIELKAIQKLKESIDNNPSTIEDLGEGNQIVHDGIKGYIIKPENQTINFKIKQLKRGGIFSSRNNLFNPQYEWVSAEFGRYPHHQTDELYLIPIE